MRGKIAGEVGRRGHEHEAELRLPRPQAAAKRLTEEIGDLLELDAVLLTISSSKAMSDAMKKASRPAELSAATRNRVPAEPGTEASAGS